MGGAGRAGTCVDLTRDDDDVSAQKDDDVQIVGPPPKKRRATDSDARVAAAGSSAGLYLCLCLFESFFRSMFHREGQIKSVHVCVHAWSDLCVFLI